MTVSSPPRRPIDERRRRTTAGDWRANRTSATKLVGTAGLLVGLLVGCQVLVPGDVPNSQCIGIDPSSCPSGMACDGNRGICVPLDDISEGGVDGHPGPTPESGPDVKQPSPVGGKCVTDSDCATGLLCGTTTILTAAIVRDGLPICTKACCTSDDCGDGFICYAPGTGGTYCVKADLADRTPLGTAKAGDACSIGDDCRSGLCQNQHCMDTCCGAQTCGNGTACRYTALLPGPTVAGVQAQHDSWECDVVPESGGDAGAGSTCGSNTQCADFNCIKGSLTTGFRCTPTCCKADDCTAAGLVNNVCAYGSGDNDQLKWCKEPNAAGAPEGQPCSIAQDCAGLYCDSSTHKCGRPCCVDADCKTGESCKPSTDSTPFLRCVTH
jgi:hypothetical protein